MDPTVSALIGALGGAVFGYFAQARQASAAYARQKERDAAQRKDRLQEIYSVRLTDADRERRTQLLPLYKTILRTTYVFQEISQELRVTTGNESREERDKRLSVALGEALRDAGDALLTLRLIEPTQEVVTACEALVHQFNSFRAAYSTQLQLQEMGAEVAASIGDPWRHLDGLDEGIQKLVEYERRVLEQLRVPHNPGTVALPSGE